MTVINDTSNHDINEEVEYSNVSIAKKMIAEKSGMSNELEEEAYLCFVLGYN